MRTFNNLKRDFRGLYRPRHRSRRRDRAHTLDNDAIDALHVGSAIPMDSVESPRVAEAARPSTAPAGQAGQFAQPSSGGHQEPVITRELASDDVDTDLRMDDQSEIRRPLSVALNIEEPAGQAGESAGAQSDHDHEASVSAEEPDICGDDTASHMEPQSDTGRPRLVAEDVGEYEDDFHKGPVPEDDEEAPVLTFEEAQSIRDQVYVTFASEGREDYTAGPARFIQAADGVQHCVALLMTFDLSQAIQEAIQGHREFLRVETAAMFHRQTLLRLEGGVRREIASCNTRLAIMEEEGRLESDDARNLGQQLEKLELMHSDVQGRRQNTHTEVEVQARQLRSLQATVNAHLEEAYICAHLLAQEEEEPEPEIEDLDVAQEYEIFCRKLETANDEPFEAAAPPLDMNTEHLEVPPPSEEEQAHQKIINALWESKETLDQARRDFEEREVLRTLEFQANMAAADLGEATTDDSPEAFDVRWVVRYGELTRNLIDAEAAYAPVKRTAFEAGVPLPFVDNETVCEAVEDEGVGYTISKEQEFVASVPSPTVRRWLAKVPEGVEVGSPSFCDEGRSEADEWEAEEVGISDSVSLVAEGRERVRIDRWREACVAEQE